MKRFPMLGALFLAAAIISPVRADDFATRCADRAAIERVYHSHRLETRQTFEETMPAAHVERLVRLDQRKEAALSSAYGVTITDAEVQAEARRIELTTRAPEILAELQAALGRDPARFARAVARPIVVERALRARFENDNQLHAGPRRAVEQARAAALAARKDGVATQAAALSIAPAGGGAADVTWQLGARPAMEEDQPAASRGAAASVSYSNDATATFAQVLDPSAAAGGGLDRKFYFDDLDPELQRVLCAQLRAPGDVSAVIETPAGFQVFLAREISPAHLRVASLAVLRRDYDAWLAALALPAASTSPSPRP